MEVVRRTIQATTQLAKAIVSFPMTRHFRARFPQLWRYRINEIVCEDDYHGKEKAIGGWWFAAIFYGVTSQMINVYGMKTKAQVPKAYKDFIREEGIPGRLHRDNAKQNDSEELAAMNRE